MNAAREITLRSARTQPLHRAWWWSKKLVGGGLAAIGLAGLPDDIATWAGWINMVYDPAVTYLATRAAEIAEFVNQWWVRGIFLAAGLSLVAWAWRPFWRWRRRWLFRWRRLVVEQVWISKSDALQIIKSSPWGRLKEPNVIRTVSLLDSVTMPFTKERTVYGMSEVQKKLLKYDIFIGKTFDRFCSANPKSCRTTEDGIEQVDETAIRDFLEMAMDEEITSEFGDIPEFTVG